MRRLLIAATVLGLVLSTHTFAQTTNATLGGTVSDPTGAFIPGVTVTATNSGTGIVTTVPAAADSAPMERFAELTGVMVKVSVAVPVPSALLALKVT